MESNQKNTLIVFAGKPGVGKTTLIQHLFQNENTVDVLPYVMAYRDRPGSVPKEKTLLGYQDMYRALRQMLSQKENRQIILELGTNHPELNIQELERIQESNKVIFFLCIAPNEVCKERALGRDQEIALDQLEHRLQRDFPNSYTDLLEKTDITYHLINTAKSIEETIEEIKHLYAK